MKFSFTILVIVVLCIFNTSPCRAQSGEEEDGEESENNIREILEGNSVNDNDDGDENEYDIIHKVVIGDTNEEEDEASADAEEENNDDDDDEEIDDDDEEIDEPLPYEKYKDDLGNTRWRVWPRHPLYVVILGG